MSINALENPDGSLTKDADQETGSKIMSVPVSTEKRMFTASEFDVVERTHYPAICGLSREAMTDSLKLLCDYRKKARGRAQHQRREMRGVAELRGIAAATDHTGAKNQSENLRWRREMHQPRTGANQEGRERQSSGTAPPRLPYGLQAMHVAAHEAEHAN